MDPKEYRKVFRRALAFIRDVEKALGSPIPFLAEFEAAYSAEQESTEALEREVACSCLDALLKQVEVVITPNRARNSQLFADDLAQLERLANNVRLAKRLSAPHGGAKEERRET